MALKDIVVHLDGGLRDRLRLDMAAGLAAAHGAHLTGVFVVDVPESAFFYGGAVPYASGGPDLVAQTRAEIAASAAPVEALFRETLRVQGVEGEWRLTEGRTGPMMALNARYADLAVVGQPHDPDARDTDRGDDVVVSTLLSAGRPVLAVPFAGSFPTVGDRVLVAWSATRESTRAVHDALPILRRASVVTVLAVNPSGGVGGHGDVPAADIALHLARHGVNAQAAHTVATDIKVGEALLSYAADLAADLIVAGGYGHSRARELVFGGVTQTLLREMTVPVLLSH